MNQLLVALGIAAIFIGIVLVFIGSLIGEKKSNVQVGVGGFIGPIPVGLATSREALYLVVAIMVAMLLYLLVLSRP